MVGLVVGPILGSAIGEAIPAAMDGMYAAAKGTVKEAWSGLKKGVEKGGQFAEWVTSKFHSHHDAAPAPKPTEKKH